MAYAKCPSCGTLNTAAPVGQSYRCRKCGTTLTTVVPTAAQRVVQQRERTKAIVTLVIAVAITGWFLWAIYGPQEIKTTVTATSDSGSYVAHVENTRDLAAVLTCTVSGGGGIDTFVVSLAAGEATQHDGALVMMASRTTDLSITCI